MNCQIKLYLHDTMCRSTDILHGALVPLFRFLALDPILRSLRGSSRLFSPTILARPHIQLSSHNLCFGLRRVFHYQIPTHIVMFQV